MELLISLLHWFLWIYWRYFLVSIGLLASLLVLHKLSPIGTKLNYIVWFAIAGTTYSNVGGLLLPVLFIRPKHCWNLRATTWFVRKVSSVTGFSWEFRGANIAAEDRGAVVCSNHQSAIDLFANASFAEIFKRVTYVAKKEMFYVFPFGVAAWLCNLAFVDRKNARSSYATLMRMKNMLIDKRLKLVFFPEGTRYQGDKFLPFKRGAFLIAIQAQVPVIPMVMSPYYYLDSKKGVFLHEKKHNIVSTLAPIPTKGLTEADVDALKDKVYNVMMAEYEKLSAEIQMKMKEKNWLTKSRPRLKLVDREIKGKNMRNGQSRRKNKKLK